MAGWAWLLRPSINWLLVFIPVLLIAAGNFEVVKASLIGSIVGNLLLVLGLSLFVGGLRCGEQAFSARAAGVHTGSLVLAIAGLGVPALLVATSPGLSAGDRQI